MLTILVIDDNASIGFRSIRWDHVASSASGGQGR